jgi:hypothetical protein
VRLLARSTEGALTLRHAVPAKRRAEVDASDGLSYRWEEYLNLKRYELVQ